MSAPAPQFSSAALQASHRQPKPKAFSLVEVVLALGIVTFALVTVVGLFGGVVGQAGENSERRSLLEAVDAMRGHLDRQPFATNFNWARNGHELVYVTFRADANDQPATNGQRTLGRWLETNAPDLDTYDSARVGRWVKARLRVSPSNPRGTNLTDVTNYPAGVLAILVQMDSVSLPQQTLDTNNPRIQTTIGVIR